MFLSKSKVLKKLKVLVAQSCLTLRSHGLQPGPLSMKFSKQNTEVGSHSLFQAIFLTQELNLGLLHCRQVLCPLRHQGNPEVLKCVPKILYTNPLPAKLCYEVYDSSVRVWCNRRCKLNSNTLEIGKLTPKGYTTLCSLA